MTRSGYVSYKNEREREALHEMKSIAIEFAVVTFICEQQTPCGRNPVNNSSSWKWIKSFLPDSQARKVLVTTEKSRNTKIGEGREGRDSSFKRTWIIKRFMTHGKNNQHYLLYILFSKKKTIAGLAL